MSAIRAGPRLHRPAHGGQVRRLLPRARGRAARRCRLGRGHARRCPDTPGVTGDPDRRDDRAALQRPRRPSRRRSPSTAREIACVITEAAAGQHGRGAAAARLQRRRCASCAPRHGALLIMDEVMTGFRVLGAGWYGARRRRRGPVHLRQGDGRRLPGGGVRRPCRRDGATSRPAGPVYQAGTLSGNPVATAAGLATLRTADAEVYTAPRRDGAHGRPRWPRTRSPPRASRTRCSTPATCSRSSSPTPRSSTSPARRPQRRRRYTAVLPRHARRRRLPAAERLRGLVRHRAAHDDAALARIAEALPAAAAPRPRPRASDAPGSGMTRSIRLQTVVHLMRHGEVHNPDRRAVRPAARLPALSELGGRWPSWRRRVLRRARRRATVVASPLERAQADRGADRRRAAGCEVATDERLIEAANVFEGKRFSVGDGRAQATRRTGKLFNPFRPSWGEPYTEQVARVLRRARGGRGTGRRRARGGLREPPAADLGQPAAPPSTGRLWHDPRKRAVLAGLGHLVRLRRANQLVGVELPRAVQGPASGRRPPRSSSPAPDRPGRAPARPAHRRPGHGKTGTCP